MPWPHRRFFLASPMHAQARAHTTSAAPPPMRGSGWSRWIVGVTQVPWQGGLKAREEGLLAFGKRLFLPPPKEDLNLSP